MTATVPIARRDPREVLALTDRDYLALEYVMEGLQETQANVDRAVFGNSSKTPCGRAINRLKAAGFLKVERWNGIGANFLRGTNAARTALIERGVDADRLFVPDRPIAAKDLAHHMWINDVRLVLRTRGFADVTPCWALRRRLAAFKPPAIPDVLAFRQSGSETESVLAVEVDMGTEALKVLVPKLELLRGVLATWAAGAPAAILVLTVGPRRILAMEQAVAGTGVTIRPLPRGNGRARLDELSSLMNELAGER